MSSEHTISIATAGRDGPRGERPVSMPVDELLASNGLVTGQSGTDPAGSVCLIAESLVDAGETVFVVDPAGDFSALVDHSSVLHVGGDRDCDVRVEPNAVDRVAALALDGDTSIVLDLAAFDAGEADDLLGSLTDELVGERRSRRSDLLLVVNDCHRWLAATGPATRTGENVVQLGGRRHDGVGIVGVTDQPADVREDVRSGVDWVLAHRLTWQEDVRALEGMLGRTDVDALETLDDDQAIFNAGWERDSQRLTVGLDSARDTAASNEPTSNAEDTDDLFAGLPEARTPDTDGAETDGRGHAEAGEDRQTVDALRDELAAVENRLASLEAKLEAREDVEEMADRIADAITEGLQDADFGRSTAPRRSGTDDSATDSRSTAESGSTAHSASTAEPADSPQRSDDTGSEDTADDGPSGFGDVFDAFGDDSATTRDTGTSEPEPSDAPASGTATADSGPDAATDAESSGGENGSSSSDSSSSRNGTDGGGMSFEPIDFSFENSSQDADSTVPDDFGPPSRHGSSGRTIPRYLRKIVRGLEEMDLTTRRMLAYYVEEGTESPMDAHFSAGGGGDRTRAYAHNRQLRTNGLIEHVGKGKYAPRLREYVVDEAGHSVPEHELDRAVDVIHQTVEDA